MIRYISHWLVIVFIIAATEFWNWDKLDTRELKMMFLFFSDGNQKQSGW